MSIEPDFSLILSAYETDDELGKVLRAHLCVEQQMERFIKLVSMTKVDKKTSYWAKVNLLRAIGVPEKICAACDNLNELRNELAHNSQANLANTKDISRGFLGSVEAFFPKLAQAHGTLARSATKVSHEFAYIDADQGQRVVIAAAFLSSIVGVLPKLFEFGSRPQIARLSVLEL